MPGVLLRGVAHPADPVLQDAVFDPFRDDRLNVELFVRVHVTVAKPGALFAAAQHAHCFVGSVHVSVVCVAARRAVFHGVAAHDSCFELPHKAMRHVRRHMRRARLHEDVCRTRNHDHCSLRRSERGTCRSPRHAHLRRSSDAPDRYIVGRRRRGTLGCERLAHVRHVPGGVGPNAAHVCKHAMNRGPPARGLKHARHKIEPRQLRTARREGVCRFCHAHHFVVGKAGSEPEQPLLHPVRPPETGTRFVREHTREALGHDGVEVGKKPGLVSRVREVRM